MPPRSPSNPASERRSDAELVAHARDGDRGAFDALVLRHQDLVFNMSYRILADREDALDVAQDVFLTVYRSLPRFEERARFTTWLHRITVNRCRDELRRRGSVKHTRPRSLDALARRDGDAVGFEPEADGPTPTETAVGHEAATLVERAIAALPDEIRETLVLRDVEDLAYEEIADVLGVPVGTVRSRLHRARALLKESLRELLEVEP